MNKLTLKELDIHVRKFVSDNQDLLLCNIDCMENLPEVLDMFSGTGWTVAEYQAEVYTRRDPFLDTFDVLVDQLLELGVSEEEITQMFLQENT